ncbi:MAG: PASTA domain-containing protein [Candidatus Sumerlaeaceae bacterium]
MADPEDRKSGTDDAKSDIPPTSNMPAAGSSAGAIPSQPRSFVPQSKTNGKESIGPEAASKADVVVGKISPPAATEDKPTAGEKGQAVSAFPASATPSAKPALGPVRVTGTGGGTSALRPNAAPTPGGGGDTIRLRVNPKAGSAFGSGAAGPPRSARQRLPDIRRRQTARSTVPTYGPFSLFFGFVWLIFKMVFFTALVLALGVGLGYAILWWYIKTPEVTVPNVRGMKIAEAFEVLSDKKLGMVKVRSESSGLVAPGEIVEQSPPAGSMFKQGRAVGVVISSGRSKFTVPNVVGESVENARNKIRGANLEVGTELRMEDASVPKEAIISQQPAANTGLDEPTKVDLLVSSGPPGKGLTMPNVTGVTFGEAKAALSRLGMTEIVTEPPGQADGTVVAQEPLVGKTILQTDRVTLRLRK